MTTPFPYSTARRDVTIPQGATWTYALTWEQPRGTPVVMTGWTGRMQIRERVGSAVLAELTTENGRIVIDGPTGTVTLTLPPGAIGGSIVKAVYDLELIQASPEWTVRLLEGKVTISPDVTR